MTSVSKAPWRFWGRLVLYFTVPVGLTLVPASLLEAVHPVCIFRNIFNTDCPGCGMTRAVLSVMHGDLTSALRYNRLVVLVFPLLGYVYVQAIRAEVIKRLH